jgi:hypothetical protein
MPMQQSSKRAMGLRQLIEQRLPALVVILSALGFPPHPLPDHEPALTKTPTAPNSRAPDTNSDDKAPANTRVVLRSAINQSVSFR